jgi:hypothetical protein
MTLRAKIEKEVAAGGGDYRQAAIRVCRLLENEIGLAGNGWFDDDEELQRLLATSVGPAGATDVWDAPDRLQDAVEERLRAAGVRPTVANLQRELGSVSNADIAALLGVELPADEIAWLRQAVHGKLDIEDPEECECEEVPA